MKLTEHLNNFYNFLMTFPYSLPVIEVSIESEVGKIKILNQYFGDFDLISNEFS